MKAADLRLRALQIAAERNARPDDYSHGATWLEGVSAGLERAMSALATQSNLPAARYLIRDAIAAAKEAAK